MPSDLAVVLDTNVWISGIFYRRGMPAAILRAWRDRRFEIVATPETLIELERKLHEKTSQFGAEPTLVSEWITYIKTFARIVTPTTGTSGVCRDPDDDKFLAAALSGHASYIVSGDHDLQALDTYQDVKVLSPREFVEILGLISPHSPTSKS